MKLILLMATIILSYSSQADTCFNLLRQFEGMIPVRVLKAKIKPQTTSNQIPVYEKSLKSRVASFDISERMARKSLQSLRAFHISEPRPLLGDGIQKCFDSFSETAFNVTQSFIKSATDKRSLDESFEAMRKRSQEIFNESSDAAKRRICSLSNPRSQCKIFSKSLFQAGKCN